MTLFSENRPGITENKLDLLLKSLSDDWQGNQIFNSTRSSLSPNVTSKNEKLINLKYEDNHKTFRTFVS